MPERKVNSRVSFDRMVIGSVKAVLFGLTIALHQYKTHA
ncbi:hypothetical protein ADIS_3680 [Lunatimonas lonarensis]|uniref:Uncharacterized protein n=1 Tax=Lunatimonas lonarensis TaxID=1232681 RepID=R7ZP39_9BACT|nr:hypothetical protein ADIS_3680 [Lunatimonas lonarensis]